MERSAKGDDLFQVTVEADSPEGLSIFKGVTGVDFGCRPHATALPGGRFRTIVFVPSTQLPRVLAFHGSHGRAVRFGANVSGLGRQRQREVAHRLPPGATRFYAKFHPNLPHFFGINAYLTQDLIDQQLQALANEYPSFCQLIQLPHLSVEGRPINMLKLGHGNPQQIACALFTACAHAREWGGAEIMVNLATDLADAFSANIGITYGNLSYSAAQIQALFAEYCIFIVPVLNPDGRTYSMTTEPLWRKNRDNPAVDLNRNYDFLWNIDQAFDPNVIALQGGAAGVLGSDGQFDACFHGNSPLSEPETQNMVWIYDTYPLVTRHVDVHSFEGDVLYAWGDAPDQSTNPQMNFQNAAFNGKRGVANTSVYGEYINQYDLYTFKSAAAAMTTAIGGVRGQAYTPKTSFAVYPVSGAVCDYAYARHVVDPKKFKIYAFTIEFGIPPKGTSEQVEFQPPFPEMARIIEDVDAGLIAFLQYKIDPCGPIQAQLTQLTQALATLEKQHEEGFIPKPNTPANRLAYEESVTYLNGQISQLKNQLFQCQAQEGK